MMANFSLCDEKNSKVQSHDSPFRVEIRGTAGGGGGKDKPTGRISSMNASGSPPSATTWCKKFLTVIAADQRISATRQKFRHGGPRSRGTQPAPVPCDRWSLSCQTKPPKKRQNILLIYHQYPDYSCKHSKFYKILQNFTKFLMNKALKPDLNNLYLRYPEKPVRTSYSI